MSPLKWRCVAKVIVLAISVWLVFSVGGSNGSSTGTDPEASLHNGLGFMGHTIYKR
jgi:hypothetical protein